MNMSDLPTEEVRRRAEESRAASHRLAREIAQAAATLNALVQQQHATIAAGDQGARVLAWRHRTGADQGDIDTALDELATRIAGGTLAALRSTEGRGEAEIIDTTGRRWRVTFAGDATGYWLPDYTLIDDAKLPGATVLSADWDDSWLIEATLGDIAIHIRLQGDALSVEEIHP